MAVDGEGTHIACRTAVRRLRCWPGANLALVVLTVLLPLLFSPSAGFAQPSHHTVEQSDGTGGGGLFSLSLEEVLDIRVDIAEHFVENADGAFLLSRHELVKLHVHSRIVERALEKASHAEGISSTGVPVLINGEYFGDFSSLSEAARYLRRLGRAVQYVELYAGNRAEWFEKGRARVLLNVTVVAEQRRSHSDSPVDSESEVLP